MENQSKRLKFGRNPKRRRTDINWLNLPDHLVAHIAHKLLNVNDFIRFGAVCKFWYSIYTYEKQAYISTHPQVPLLMLNTENVKHGDSIPFYSLADNRVFDSSKSTNCLKFTSCFGVRSTRGWLAKLSTDYRITLFNPFLKANNVINLPPLITSETTEEYPYFEDDYLRKIIVSHDPGVNPNYTIMAIYGRNEGYLAFYRSGNKTWMGINVESRMVDVVYHGNRFYFVDCYEKLYVGEHLDTHHPKLSRVSYPPHSIAQRCEIDGSYLVESSGELLLIRRERDHIGESCYTTSVFYVFKLDWSENKWIRLRSLCGWTVFVGDNSSFALKASDSSLGCKSNCVYFTDDFSEGYLEICKRQVGHHDMGIFDLETGSLTRDFWTKDDDVMDPPPTWVELTLPSTYHVA